MCKLASKGEADAVISAGNTGACVAASQLRMRLLPGVARPGIAVIIPTFHGPVVLCDVGANIAPRLKHLQQYAMMAGAYATAVLGIEDYFHYILSSQSDPMLVTCVLAAIDMGLIGRYRWTLLFGVLAMGVPAYAQIELTGSYSPILYEDYIERGPGSDLGDFTGMPMTDEGRAKALLYTSNLPSTIERQCLAQAPWVLQYRPLGMRIWNEVDKVLPEAEIVLFGGEVDRGEAIAEAASGFPADLLAETGLVAGGLDGLEVLQEIEEDGFEEMPIFGADGEESAQP